MKLRPQLKTASVMTLILAGSLSLAAWTGGDNPDAEKTATSGPQETGVISPELTKAPDLQDGAKGIRANTTMDECTTNPGEVVAKGKVKNASDSPQDIVLTVSWITERSDVVARGVQTLEQVPAGEERDWETKAELKYDGGPVTCALNAKQGSLAK